MAEADWWRTRTCRVRKPRSSSAASNEPRMAPSIVRSRAARSQGRPLAREHHRAGDDVGMAVEILGGRVQHDIGAEREGAGQHRRRHRGVDGQQRAGRMRAARRLRDVRDDPGRVRRRLDPDEPRAAGPDGRAERARVAGIDEGHLQAVARRILASATAAGPSTSPWARPRARAAPAPRNAAGCRGHAGREQQARCAALQLGQDVLDLPYRGVVGAAVAVAPSVLVVRIAHEGRGHMDGRNDGAGGGIDRAAGLGRRSSPGLAGGAVAIVAPERGAIFPLVPGRVQARRGRRFWRASAAAGRGCRVVTRSCRYNNALRGIRWRLRRRYGPHVFVLLVGARAHA